MCVCVCVCLAVSDGRQTQYVVWLWVCFSYVCLIDLIELIQSVVILEVSSGISRKDKLWGLECVMKTNGPIPASGARGDGITGEDICTYTGRVARLPECDWL